jgi:hypothetical protein
MGIALSGPFVGSAFEQSAGLFPFQTAFPAFLRTDGCLFQVEAILLFQPEVHPDLERLRRGCPEDQTGHRLDLKK